ncbi:hypothetical protein [Gordonia sp. (in: high G+C Gram-positive bacteria)]|uniref:hypothetical protein n=1 Tax=Gordonia sp. (in: high G+C Gram-positive bacteria) TaxID=84139 RepID=UPI003C7940BB
MTGPFSRQPSWLTGFDLPALPTGAVIALDFSPDGLWAARMERGEAGTFAAVESTTETRIHPEVLDARIATYLRDTGKASAPTDELFDELISLARRARRSLIDRDTTVVMGGATFAPISFSIDDAIEATVPETNRAHGMVMELAGLSPVDAILLGPGLDDWPGLPRALTERGFTPISPGDPFPATFGGDNEATALLEAVQAPQEVRAWEHSDQNLVLVDPADYGLDRFGNAVPDVYADSNETYAGAEPEREAGMRGRLVALGGVVLLAVGGGGVAIAMNADEQANPGIGATHSSTTSTPSGSRPSTPEPERVNNSVDPADMSAARVPVLKYTTPPPPPKSTSQPRSTQARPAPGPLPPGPPQNRPKRTIPNPIPGLPPIVVG